MRTHCEAEMVCKVPNQIHHTAKMTRGEGFQTKVHHKGKLDDYVVFIDDVTIYEKWFSDKSIPLAHFISPLTVFLTHK